MTTLVCVRGLRPAEFFSDPKSIYIGRGFPRQGWTTSPWGNPFKADICHGAERLTAQDCVRMFERRLKWAVDYLRAHGPGPHAVMAIDARFLAMAARLGELHERILGCWCGSWQPGEPEIPCHGVCLIKALATLEAEPPTPDFGELKGSPLLESFPELNPIREDR